eukprot:TRINITY_DN8373_c0_g2_i1.p1 TRINITY_DN8373_c0_g2~~TRINITY_DN8373_c0_g2_i1.p1  ORF type:complete len:478 (-),score=46.60 TRINITY_DN8373_c0_g2_i1:69-1502(-)
MVSTQSTGALKMIRAFLVVALFTIAVESGLISSLPGLAFPPPFKQYAGYKTVDEEHGRALFYWFAESQSTPEFDPVVLWLTGGPGCSSLIAFLSENGPFRPNIGGETLRKDPYSWNQKANVIWLESPAGVGFSYSNDSSDYHVGDNRTKYDTLKFLQLFFEEFPQFKDNGFWVTGESYGGHYVPEITQLVYESNKALPSNKQINIKGMMVGNAWTYMPIDNRGAIETWWTRFLVPEEQSMDLIKTCNLSHVGPLMAEKPEWKVSDACDNLINKVMSVFNDIDIYDIYVDVCFANREATMMENMKQQLLMHRHILDTSKSESTPLSAKRIPFDPCVDAHLTTYFNRKDVQHAIHARDTTWSECSSVVDYNYTDIESSVIPIYIDLLNNTEIDILVYSGDVDAIVPTYGTRLWTRALGRKVLEPWRVWLDENHQAGGVVEVYDRFTFATVRDAGHMVPFYQPQRAWTMFYNFMTRGALP